MFCTICAIFVSNAVQRPLTLGNYLRSIVAKGVPVAARVISPEDIQETYPDKRNLYQREGYQSEFKGSYGGGLAWDSSSLLPLYIPTDTDKDTAGHLGLLAKITTLPGINPENLYYESPSVFASGGVPISQVDQAISSEIRRSVPYADKAMKDPGCLMRFKASPYVAFIGSDGQYRQFFFRRSASTSSILSGLNLTKREEPRVPTELRRAFNDRLAGLTQSQRPFRVSEILSSLQSVSPVALRVDRRVSEDFLYIETSTATKATDLAELLARAMDMYWRRVGTRYMLACSPGDPRVLARQRYLAKMSDKARSILEAMAAAGSLPAGLSADDILNGPVGLSELDPTSLRQLGLSLDFRSPDERQSFMSTISSSNFRSGTVQISASGTLSLISPSNGVDVGVAIDLLDVHP